MNGTEQSKRDPRLLVVFAGTFAIASVWAISNGDTTFSVFFAAAATVASGIAYREKQRMVNSGTEQ